MSINFYCFNSTLLLLFQFTWKRPQMSEVETSGFQKLSTAHVRLGFDKHVMEPTHNKEWNPYCFNKSIKVRFFVILTIREYLWKGASTPIKTVNVFYTFRTVAKLSSPSLYKEDLNRITNDVTVVVKGILAPATYVYDEFTQGAGGICPRDHVM